MNDDAAAKRVKETLLALPGVGRVDAKADGQAAVEYDASVVTTMDLIRALRRIGFTAGME